MGVIRPSGGANAGAGCWPTCWEQSPTSRFLAKFGWADHTSTISERPSGVLFPDEKHTIHAKPCFHQLTVEFRIVRYLSGVGSPTCPEVCFWSITVLVRSRCGTCPRSRFRANVTSERYSEHYVWVE